MTVKVIAINGPPRVGKDTLAKELLHKLGDSAAVVELKAGLFNIINLDYLFGYDKSYEQMKEENPQQLREVLRKLSEQVIKPIFGQDFFAHELCDNIDNLILENPNIKYVIVPDLGFNIEVDVLHKAYKNNLTIVSLVREGCDFSEDSRYYTSYDLRFTNLLLDEYPKTADIILKHIKDWS